MTDDVSRWIVCCASVKLRASPNQYSKALDVLYQDTEVNGMPQGDWLKLADEPGYIMIRRQSIQFVKRLVKSFEEPVDEVRVESRPKGSSSESSNRKSSTGQAVFEPHHSSCLDHKFSASSSGPSGEEGDEKAAYRVERCEDGEARAASESIPQDGVGENGSLLSVGSALHASLKCRPCIYVPNCGRGAACKFCHSPEHEYSDRQARIRPCKGRREKYKRFVAKTFEEIERNPDSFDLESVRLPATIECTHTLKQGFLASVNSKLTSLKEPKASPRDSSAAVIPDYGIQTRGEPSSTGYYVGLQLSPISPIMLEVSEAELLEAMPTHYED